MREDLAAVGDKLWVVGNVSGNFLVTVSNVTNQFRFVQRAI